MKEWLINEKNGQQIYDIIKSKITNYQISQKHIYEILTAARFYISHYYKDLYILEDYSVENNHDSYSVDESQFIRNDNVGVWLIGIINNSTKKFRLAMSEIRDAETLKFSFIKMLKMVIE